MPHTKKRSDEYLNQQLADRIKQAIEDKYGSVSEGLPFIEQAIPVSKRTVYKWMDDGQIRLNHIRSLANHLEVTVGWLLEDTDQHHAQHKRVSDHNILSFKKQVEQRQIDPALDPVEETLYMRHVPIIEPDDVVKTVDSADDPIAWQKAIKDFVEKPNKAHLTISHYQQTLGLPTYAFQLISNWYEPYVRSGELCGMATDIVPVVGDFTAYAIYDEQTKEYFFAIGFFYPVQTYMDVRRLAHSHKRLKSFVLKLKQDGRSLSPGDLEVHPHAQFPPKCVGVMTYSTYWHSRANREVNTALHRRVQQAHQMRGLTEEQLEMRGIRYEPS